MKLLLAEDDIKLGALVKSLLEFSGFETEWARDGREALERIREAAASSYDVVILDWMLPEISGIEICRLLRNPRKYNYQGGIIFLTARDGTDDCVTGLESGADDPRECARPAQGQAFRRRHLHQVRRGDEQPYRDADSRRKGTEAEPARV